MSLFPIPKHALDFSAKDIQGQPVDLNQYLGKIVVVVNTASHCGFTPQYKGLEALYQQYQARGLTILGFPCNQFGLQEPGDAASIATFCERNFGVTFPLFNKIDVNGAKAHPLFEFLKTHAPGILGTELIKWNFTKFLIKQDGTVFKRYAPNTEPEELIEDIEFLLKA
jgi:glutathione peroxidase